MTVCKQLNYKRRKSGSYGDYSEELLADGEVNGRNWSFIERIWKRDCSFRGGKYHYILRIDISEYNESYHKLIYSKGYSFNDMRAMLMSCPSGCDPLYFHVDNQSPGLWENGFNPNYWLETEIGAYASEKDRLMKVIETGRDMRDMNDIGLVVQDSISNLAPFFDLLKKTAPAGVPYHHWWGVEEPPPPRKPIY